jgi:peptide/nickel transport system permease protein
MGIATAIGLTLGSIAGYVGGWWDIAISRVIEVFICVPPFYVILIVLTIFEPSIYNVMIVLGLLRWTFIGRFARAEFMKLKNLDYAMAARALGASNGRIIFRHVLPNALAPVLVVVAFGVATAIFVETGLSWLGFGVMPPTPTWGNILRAGWDNLRIAPHLIFPPSIAVFVTVLTMNLIGDALRDVTDPRLVSSA